MVVKIYKPLSLRAKIILAALVIVTSAVVLYLATSAIKQHASWLQYVQQEYEVVEVGNVHREFSTVKEAIAFVQEKEGNVTLVLRDLRHNPNPECGGYEYGIYVNERNVFYDICQSGKYTIYRPKPFGVEAVSKKLNEILDRIERGIRAFFFGEGEEERFLSEE